MDLKASQMQGFFDKPIDNLYAAPTLAHWIKHNIPDSENLVVVSKDPDGTKRVAELADRLKVNFAMVHTDKFLKEASDEQQAKADVNEEEILISQSTPGTTTLVGDVRNRPIIILDDTIDKPDMIIHAANHCKTQCSAQRVYVAATHGDFLDDCLQKLEQCDTIDKVIVTNTHPINHEVASQSEKLEVIDVSMIFAECIRRLHNGESISQLFSRVERGN